MSNISNIRALAGISAVETATATNTDWRETVGVTSKSITIPSGSSSIVHEIVIDSALSFQGELDILEGTFQVVGSDLARPATAYLGDSTQGFIVDAATEGYAGNLITITISSSTVAGYDSSVVITGNSVVITPPTKGTIKVESVDGEPMTGGGLPVVDFHVSYIGLQAGKPAFAGTPAQDFTITNDGVGQWNILHNPTGATWYSESEEVDPVLISDWLPINSNTSGIPLLSYVSAQNEAISYAISTNASSLLTVNQPPQVPEVITPGTYQLSNGADGASILHGGYGKDMEGNAKPAINTIRAIYIASTAGMIYSGSFLLLGNPIIGNGFQLLANSLFTNLIAENPISISRDNTEGYDTDVRGQLRIIIVGESD